MSGKAKIPIYRHIKQRIREDIEGGIYKPGDRVPSEQALADELGVSRGQARLALRDLQMEGYLSRTRGRGSFVTPAGQRSARDSAASLPTVTVALPFSPTYYLQNVIKGLAESLNGRGFHSTFYYLTFDPEPEHEFLRKVTSSGSTGLALWPCFRSQEECELVAGLCAERFPCVTFDRYLPMIPVDFVGTDNRRAYREITESLLDKGHSRIGFVARDLADSVMEDRLGGYLDAASRAGIPFHGVTLRRDFAGNWPDAEQLRSLGLRERFADDTAICCSDEHTATLLIEHAENALPERGESITIATMYDEDPDQPFLDIPFLVMCQDGYEVGRQTGELLALRIQDPNRPIEHRLVPARLTSPRPMPRLEATFNRTT